MTADLINSCDVVPTEKRISPGARKLRDFYDMKPGAALFQREFWLMPDTLDAWRKQGMPENVPWETLFGFDPRGKHELWGLGWCEAAMQPVFEEKIIESRNDCEVVQDQSGRHVLFFKDRRCGFMPEYLDHPVKDWKTWETNVKWRLDPASPERYVDIETQMTKARAAVSQGLFMTQQLIGGFMYLRSLFGPEGILYAVHDEPDLIHDCMKTWLTLADGVIARHQAHVTFDEIFFAEDICYNHGSLISPDMMREFLFPYYQQLITNMKGRQRDRTRVLHIQVDTDGWCDPVIPVYQEAIGLDAMSPFEVASGSDVVRTGKEHPNLRISGGIDKRILSRSKQEIDEMVERILPVMRARGGFIPTVDHGTPPEVPYAHYLHFRKRCLELGN